MKKDIWEKKFSDNYKATFLTSLIKRFESYRQDVMISLLPEKGNVLLDLACGDGDLLFKVKDRFAKLVGFDIARNRIANAQKKLKGLNCILKVTDLDNGIPLEKESIDVVVCEASLQYFYDVEFILKEIHRSLKKGGIFIVQVPNLAYLPRRLSLLLGSLPKTSSFSGFGDGGALHYFTYSELELLLNSIGFRIDEKTNSGVLANLRKIYQKLLAGDIILRVTKL